MQGVHPFQCEPAAPPSQCPVQLLLAHGLPPKHWEHPHQPAKSRSISNKKILIKMNKCCISENNQIGHNVRASNCFE